MAFKPSAGYGDLFSYTRANISTDGFEVKNISRDVLRFAIGQLVFARFLNESRDSFGVGKGGTFTVPIFRNWAAPTSVSPLTPGTAIGIGTQQTLSASFVMHEYGTGIGYETIGDWITDIDVRKQLVETLGLHIARMINWLDYNVLVNTTFSIESPAPGSYTNLLGTNRQTSQAAYGELGPGGVALAYDSLKKSLVEPLTSRGQYIMVGNAETFRHLKHGSVFINQALYSDISSFKYQVLGEFMGFVFVETEELTGKGTALAIGANAGGYGFGLPPKTFYYPDYGADAGRLQVWKTIFYRGQGPIFRNIGTAVICIRTNSAPYNYSSLG